MRVVLVVIATGVTSLLGCATVKPNPPVANKAFESRLPSQELYPATGSIYNDAERCTGRLHGLVGRIGGDRTGAMLMGLGGSAITLIGGSVAAFSSGEAGTKRLSLGLALGGGLLAAITPFIGTADVDRALYDKALTHYDRAMSLLDEALLIPTTEATSTRRAEYLTLMNQAGVQFRLCGSQ
jgi:hypothetical protein